MAMRTNCQRAYVVLEELDNRCRPIAVFFSPEEAELYATQHGGGAFVNAIAIEGDYSDGQPLYACFIFIGVYRLECLFASEEDARANAGEDGKVTVIHPTNDSGLEQDGWISPYV